MNITLSTQAYKWLKHTHCQHLTLWLSPKHGCCGGTSWIPMVKAGAPDSGTDWQEFEHDSGIRIHAVKAFVEHYPVIHLTLSGLGPWKKLFVEI